ncbi:MAG: MAPEG family protein, partial [Thermomonas sp.]
MSIAYWCILIAAALPYLWVSLAKAGGERYNNSDPRGWQAKQENPRSKRAYAAQLNAFEAFPAFAASVLMAQFAQVDGQRIIWLAMA